MATQHAAVVSKGPALKIANGKDLTLNAAETLIDDLSALEPIKTWSLIVTLFGDLNGKDITGKELALLLGRVGIKTEAIRVALHRLRKDGWIESTKSGREVSYRLSSYGLAETRAAYEDVYRRDVKFPEGWQLFLLRPDTAPPDSSIALDRSVVMAPIQSVAADHDRLGLCFKGPNLPTWLTDQIAPQRTLSLAQKLHDLCETRVHDLPPLSQAAARLLMLHHWRKIALRDANWAHISLVPDGALAKCHTHITGMLHDLPKLSPATFASENGT